MDVERWAMTELDNYVSRTHMNIVEYTNSYQELNQLMSGRSELERIFQYEKGLPDEYRIKSVERKHSTLQSATEAAIAIFNARSITKSQIRPSSAHQMETDTIMNDAASSSSSSSSSSSIPITQNYNQEGYQQINSMSEGAPPQQVSSMDERLDRLTAMLTQQYNRGGFNNNFNRGGYRGRGNFHNNNNWRGRPRGGGRGGFNRNNSNSRPRSPTLQELGVSESLIEQRKSAGQCIKCGQTGHIIRGCRNEAKTTN